MSGSFDEHGCPGFEVILLVCAFVVGPRVRAAKQCGERLQFGLDYFS